LFFNQSSQGEPQRVMYLAATYGKHMLFFRLPFRAYTEEQQSLQAVYSKTHVPFFQKFAARNQRTDGSHVRYKQVLAAWKLGKRFQFSSPPHKALALTPGASFFSNLCPLAGCKTWRTLYIRGL
jgi:hypothetical protein